jgi:AraC-like DNA-binding protein
MTFYHQQVLNINNRLYPKDHLTERVIRSKHFMDLHFPDNLNMDQIAREASLSKFHFMRLFKKYYGRTPYQYLTSVRITKAKELLKAGCSVSETCYALGFDSLSSFTGFFKKTGGTTPYTFRQKKQH